jgi:hypothetical protein
MPSTKFPSSPLIWSAVCRYRSVMATTKTKSADKKADKKNKNKNAETKSSPKTGSEGATSAAKLTRKLLDKLPPIGATTRAALRSLATDAQRSDLGRQTKAPGVLADGVTMAIAIDQQIATFPSLTETYVLRRFAYFLESLLALDALIEGSSSREEKLGAARGTAANAYERADKARTKLLARLKRFAGDRGPENEEIKLVPAKGRTNDELGRSIGKAVALAQSWLARTDAESVENATLAVLDDAVVAHAVTCAAGLGGAHVDAALEGRKNANDSPIVNLEEGNVLIEMAYAMEVFEEAHADNDVVSRLSPGPATRQCARPDGARCGEGRAGGPRRRRGEGGRRDTACGLNRPRFREVASRCRSAVPARGCPVSC